MRFPVEANRTRPYRRIAGLCLLLLTSTALAACGAGGASSPPAMALVPQNGPQADYPVTIGNPYIIGETTYRPADALNYDEVGYLAAGSGQGITGAHHTLPVPSYVEVTSLESGRTILVRLERRGPMDSNSLIALSPAAMAQLGGSQNNAVRVRRVNAPENQRALLRNGEEAPLRMDTPRGLVEVLRRRLPPEGSASLAGGVQPVGSEPALANSTPAPSTPAPPLATSSMRVPGPIATTQVEPSRAASPPAPVNVLPPLPQVGRPGPGLAQGPAPETATETRPTVAAPATTAGGDFVVQAGAFSVVANAQRAASQIGGTVSHPGALYVVRTGPFATRAQAEASLANVRAAGYSDARIYNGG